VARDKRVSLIHSDSFWLRIEAAFSSNTRSSDRSRRPVICPFFCCAESFGLPIFILFNKKSLPSPYFLLNIKSTAKGTIWQTTQQRKEDDGSIPCSARAPAFAASSALPEFAAIPSCAMASLWAKAASTCRAKRRDLPALSRFTSTKTCCTLHVPVGDKILSSATKTSELPA
jgi:hypothetical protein